MKGIIIKTGLAFGLVIVLLSTNITPGLLGRSSDSFQQKSVDALFIPATEKNSVFSLNVFGKTSLKKQDVALSANDASLIFDKLKELNAEITQHPYSKKTQSLKIAFVNLLDEKGLIQNGVSKETYLSLLNPRWVERLQNTEKRMSFPQPFANRGTCALCSLGGEGSGILIPLLLLPRPRIAMLWLGTGLTTAANLLTSKGYVAEGAQTGFAFGFMGIGLSYALPGYTLYGFIGYALLASTTAEYVEHYPPNRAPTISDVLPADGGQNIPLSLSELQFRIQDADGDLMSYSVTTNPDIGSESGNLKPFGVYTVPIHGLESSTTYTWHIEVTDGKATVMDNFTFTTEAVEPVISESSPEDGTRDVSTSISHLRFKLTDFQGDAMNYTVQTYPNIGFGSGTNVHDGYYTVPITGLTNATVYKWYVNVTDGTHWTRKIFTFETIYPEQFNPFDFGWQYRKQITIDHTKVAEDLVNFPALISITDSDLHDAAQDDGDDILFMPSGGVAQKLNHEIESYTSLTGTLVAWVNITALSSTTDTLFYMYYGHPDCLSKENVKQTWDTNYKAVFHMNDSTTASIKDMTSYSITGTKTGANEPILSSSGKIGSCQSFDNYNDRINIGDIHQAHITISAWIKTPSGNTKNELIINKGYTSHTNPYYEYTMMIGATTGEATGYVTASGTVYDAHDSGVYNNNNWHYIVTRYDGSILYVSGDAGTEATNTLLSGDINYYATNAFIGGYTNLATPGDNYYFNGLIDEVRISKIARSTDWISTEFTNQNNPSSFLSFGPEEPGP